MSGGKTAAIEAARFALVAGGFNARYIGMDIGGEDRTAFLVIDHTGDVIREAELTRTIEPRDYQRRTMEWLAGINRRPSFTSPRPLTKRQRRRLRGKR